MLPEDLVAVSSAAATDAGGVEPELLDGFLELVVAAVAAGHPLRAPQVRRYRAVGRRAARQGVALRALLDLYLSATWRLWRRLPEVHSGDPEVVVTAGEVMLRAADDVVAALAEGYQLARRSLVREQESARREFFDDLLSGQADIAGLLQRASGFGLDLAGPHAVAVVRADGAFSDAAPITADLERAVQGRKGDAEVLVATKEGSLVVVFAAPDRLAISQVCTALGRVLAAAAGGPATPVSLHRRGTRQLGSWLLGVGRPGLGADGVLRSYDEAREALRLATRLGLRGPVVDAADLLVYRVLLRDREAIADLVEAVLTPLRGARGGAGPLLDTLAVYFDAGGNTAHTARAMHLSVRAVSYRLARIHELTGYDPGRSGQRFALHAAVLGAKLLDWPSGQPGSRPPRLPGTGNEERPVRPDSNS